MRRRHNERNGRGRKKRWSNDEKKGSQRRRTIRDKGGRPAACRLGKKNSQGS